MIATNKPLRISKDVLDTLFVYALRGYVAQVVPPRDIWQHIEENAQRFSSQNSLDIGHLPQVPYALPNDAQQRL